VTRIWVEPFRANAFPVLKDLAVDRSAFDRIVQAGGYITVRTGQAVEYQHAADWQGGGRCRDGCGGLYWLRCLRGRVQKR